MIYISAQPAEYYFLWQLEIQLQNFEDVEIAPENIHVLLSYNIEKGIPPYFTAFVQNNKQANFFFYPDYRNGSKYLSSIRPHILKQHFLKFPKLSTETICYHDCDIIFRERLNEQLLSKTNNWYFSDTRSYTSSSYLKRYGDTFFQKLCQCVDINFKLVEKNEQYSGGAQHIMKNVTVQYWEKVEEDSENIYVIIQDHNSKLKSEKKKAQAWCADMWAVLWNAWKFGKKVRLHDELAFSWPKDHISKYYQNKIFHNSGVYPTEKTEYFCKLLFRKSSPYGVDFSSIRKDSCSLIFVQQIQRLANKQIKIQINNCTLVIGIKQSPVPTEDFVIQYVNYISKYLEIEIHLVELGKWPVFNKNLICKKAYYKLWQMSDISGYLNRYVKTPFFIYTDANLLLPITNILTTIEILTSKSKKLVFPMEEVVPINVFQYSLFKDTLYLGQEKRDNFQNDSLDFIESFAMSKRDFINSGGNNSEWFYFCEDGFNLERLIRCRLLEYNIKKVPLTAFKLFQSHNRVEFKNKNSPDDYLKICKNTKEDLQRTIASRYYSFMKPFGKKIILKNISIGISALNSSTNVLTIKERLQSVISSASITEIQIKNKPSFHEHFCSLVEFAKKEKQCFIIILNEEITVGDDNRMEVFCTSLEKMNIYGLHILSAINDGGFEREIILSKELFWIDHLPKSSLFVIHESLFEKIIKYPFDKEKSIENNLSDITKHIGLVSPFLGTPRAQVFSKKTSNDQDRLKKISDIENRLVWISNTTYS